MRAMCKERRKLSSVESMKRLWGPPLLSSLVLAALAACGAADEGSGQNPGAKQDSSLQVRVMTLGPTNQGTWDPLLHREYTAVAEKQGWNLQIAEAVGVGGAETVLNRWASEKVDLVILTGSLWKDTVLSVAREFPDVNFVAITSMDTEGLPNVAAHTPDPCQIGFVQGLAGALVSESGSVAALGSIPVPFINQWMSGAEAGVETAGKETVVESRWIDSLSDAGRAQELATSLLSGGPDVLLPVGPAGMSAAIATRAQEEDAWYIGAYDDESRYAPEATITSVLTHFEKAFEELGEQVASDSFEGGQSYTGIADGQIELASFKSGFEEAEAEAKQILDKVRSGEIEIVREGDQCSSGKA